jgi:hypothetical protein
VCDTCGFPRALVGEARAARLDAPVSRPGDAEVDWVAGEAASPARPSAPPERTDDAVGGVVRQIRGYSRELMELNEPESGLVRELTQAALIDAEGRREESRALLDAISARLQAKSDAAFERRRTALEGRRANGGSAVALAPDAEPSPLRERFHAGARAEAIRSLLAAERSISHWESDWRGVRTLVNEITLLEETARSLGLEPQGVRDELERLHEILSDETGHADALDAAAERAARALMLLHEKLPAALQEELDRDEQSLVGIAPDHPRGQRARALHAEAVRHLQGGRLADTTQRLRELRQVLGELSGDEPPGDEISAGASPLESRAPALETEPPLDAASKELLSGLLRRARVLAGRVRLLPADSPTAREAAQEIRKATELLRARKLTEAELTLTRLMRTLEEGPRPRT